MVSFIIPTYNRVDYLRELLESILLQEYKEIEIIIIDDNSIDDTEKVVKEYTDRYCFIRYYKNYKNNGPGYNRRFGFFESKGEFIIFADDDDYYTDNTFLIKCLKIFEKYPTLSFISGNTYIKNESMNIIKERKLKIEGYIEKEKYLNKFQQKEYDKAYSTFSTIFNRLILEKYIPAMKIVNDSSIFMNALLYGDAYIIKDIIGVYRVHKKNISSSLNIEFIIQNLYEKKNILIKGIENNIILNPSIWMKDQYLMTIRYYFRSSKIRVLDFCKIIYWCVINIKKYRITILFSTFKCYLKNIITRTKKR